MSDAPVGPGQPPADQSPAGQPPAGQHPDGWQQHPTYVPVPPPVHVAPAPSGASVPPAARGWHGIPQQHASQFPRAQRAPGHARPAQYAPAQTGPAQYGPAQYGPAQYGPAHYGAPGAQVPPVPGSGFPPYPASGPAAYSVGPTGAWPQPQPPKNRLVAWPIPESGQSYPQAIAPLSKRWGRFFLSMGVVAAFFTLGQLVGMIFMLPGMGAAFDAFDPSSPTTQDEVFEQLFSVISTPAGFIGLNLSWGIMILGVPVALYVYGDKAAGLAHSVTGRFRWKLAAWSAVGIVPAFALYIGFSLARTPGIEWSFNPDWLMVAIVLITTPLQCAGEEYTFRGWLTQHIGSWIRFAPVAWILPAILTGLVFGAAHGLASVSSFILLSLVGITCSVLTWRTGGLEAAVVLHTCNNVFIFVPLALTGNFAAAFTPADAGTGASEDWLGLLIAIGALVLSTVWVWFASRSAQRVTGDGLVAAAALR